MTQSNCLQCGKELFSNGPRPKKWCDGTCRARFRADNDIKYQQRNTYEEQAERSKFRKLKAISLKGGACIQCGEKHPAALCFHHKDPASKEFTINGRIFGNSKWERIKEELDKCELLCYNCHQILHFGDYWAEYTSSED